MPATPEDNVTLTLTHIALGPATDQLRADPTPEDPQRRSTRTSRMYRLTFSADRPGISGTFVVDMAWDGRPGVTTCAVEDLESVGRMLVKEFAETVSRR